MILVWERERVRCGKKRGRKGMERRERKRREEKKGEKGRRRRRKEKGRESKYRFLRKILI